MYRIPNNSIHTYIHDYMHAIIPAAGDAEFDDVDIAALGGLLKQFLVCQ